MAEGSDKATKLQDGLLARVRALTGKRGERKALAEELGIHPATLSDYLADSPTRRPNGETTLLLQEWVRKREK